MRKDLIKDNRRLNFLTTEINALYHQCALKMGIADSVAIVLYAIYELGDGCRLSDIYKNTGVSKQTINSAVRSLEKDGVLFLEQHDGRSKKVVLTEKGKAFVDATSARIYNAELAAFETWSEEEIQTHLALMEKYLESFRKQVEKL